MLGLNRLIQSELHKLVGTRDLRDPLFIPDHIRLAGNLERRAGRKIDEKKCRPVGNRNVPQCIEHRVPVVIRENQSVLIDDVDESWVAASMGSIRPSLRVKARNEKRVGPCNPFLLIRREMPGVRNVRLDNRVRRIVDPLANLDVFPALRKDPFGANEQLPIAHPFERAFDFHPPAGRKLDDKHPDLLWMFEVFRQRVTGERIDADLHALLVRGVKKAFRPCHGRRPDATLSVQSRQNRHSLFFQEFACHQRNRGMDQESCVLSLLG